MDSDKHVGVDRVIASGILGRLMVMTLALDCGHIKDPLLLIGKSSLCRDNGFPQKNYVTITMCLTSNSRSYEMYSMGVVK